MKQLVEIIQNHFPINDIDLRKKSLAFISIHQNQAIPLLEWLKTTHGYKAFVLLTAVDWIEENRFQLTYLISNPDNFTELGVRVFIDREKAEMVSAHHLWKSIWVYQRELKEMFGINFPNSPRVNESFILEGWDTIPPYRRDFDTKQYSEETYFPRPGRSTNDPAKHMKSKLYPKD